MGVIRARWVPAADFRRQRKGKPRKIASIVLHSTCGRKQGDIPTLTERGGPTVSCHYYVTRAGEVYQFVEVVDVAFHAGQVDDPEHGNDRSIGIEQEHFDPNAEGPYPEGQDWPDEQVRATAQLVAMIRQKYGLLPVLSHAAIARPAGRKIDPANYPWPRLSVLVKEAMGEIWSVRRV